MLKNVKIFLTKTFAFNYFFRIIVKGIADFAQMVGYLVNQVYTVISQAMNRTFTKNLWSDISLQHFNYFQLQVKPLSGLLLRITDN
jgi:hypothetical protein